MMTVIDGAAYSGLNQGEGFIRQAMRDVLAKRKKAATTCYIVGALLISAGFICFIIGEVSNAFADPIYAIPIFGIPGLLFFVASFNSWSYQRKHSNLFHEYGMVEICGSPADKSDTVRAVEQEYQEGKIFCNEKVPKNMIYLVMERHVVAVDNKKITILPTEMIYWAYRTVHKTNGAVTHYTLQVMAGAKVYVFMFKTENQVNAVFTALRTHFPIMAGYNAKLLKLFRKKHGQFQEVYESFKRTGDAGYKGVGGYTPAE